MAVSFKVDLAGGTFAFDMAPVNAWDMAANVQPESGMKLHLKAVRDSTGVTLTLFASGNSSSLVTEEALDTAFTLPPGLFDSLFELPGSLEYSLLESFNSSSDMPYFDNAGALNGYSPFTTLSTSSEPSCADSPSPSGSWASLQSPGVSCTRHYNRTHEPSKDVKPRQHKSPKCFPCTMGCTMSFSRKHDRLRHEVTQHGRVCEWSCIACSKVFSSETTLKNHKCGKLRDARGTSSEGN
ncbi:hypothetical protein DFH09DRAFT_1098427 [Mycena vulgaris]|nr:hypothetical protein DFH09DRAFT_1098427 [Mycena vulgaris]